MKTKKSVIWTIIFLGAGILLVLSVHYCSRRAHLNPLKEEDGNLKYAFLVAGHTYGSVGATYRGLYPPFKKAAVSLTKQFNKIAFGVFTGDVVPTSTEENWKHVDADIKMLGIPVYFAVGNHDVDNRAVYEKRYGKTYSSFSYQNDLFIILDPNLDHWSISGEQLQFLNQTLTSVKSYNNIFVFFHQLLWWNEDNLFKDIPLNNKIGRGDSVNFWTEIEPMFSRLEKPVIMFAGDIGARSHHRPMYHQHENITFIASGMGGGRHDNFVIVLVYKHKPAQYILYALDEKGSNSLGGLEDYSTQ